MIHPPATVDRLRQLAATARTAREIGSMMGLSKDAVIGLCFRNDIRLLVPKSEGWRYHRRRSRFNLPQQRIEAPRHARRRRADH